MTKFLVVLSYQDPETYKHRVLGRIEDYESSTGIFIVAKSKEKAIAWA
ncbi:hypothetical protein [Xanthovirga aplysinae]|nr:hypothetical protein [Xanthovirga aplysinae]